MTASGFAGFSIPAGEAESKGVEIDAAADLTDDLRAALSCAYAGGKVTKAALANAASVASLLLTTQSAVVEKPEEEEHSHDGHGHSHGGHGHSHSHGPGF